MRKVYLDKIDIDESAKLTLNFTAYNHYLVYFMAYGTMADQVIMQGSASLKSSIIQSIFVKLKDSFSRDENFNKLKPIFSFALADDAESYVDYLKERESKLKGTNNAEFNAYKNNNSKYSANELDKSLKYVGVHKRTQSVGKLFKKNTLIDINNMIFKNKEEGIKFKIKAINIANEMDTFQSFNYIKALNIKSEKSKCKLYKLIRKNYLSSNAMANEAICTFDSIHFNAINLFNFMDSLKILNFLTINCNNNQSLLIFHLRLSQALSDLKDLYFKCQSQEEIYLFIKTIMTIKRHGIKKTNELLIQQQDTNLATHILNEFKMLETLINKFDLEMKAIQQILKKT